ncbi:HlyD family efflux transporter periplasmic adaptor subunit [Vibrio sp. SS-MA-C1-2]|uniref:HlyD family efflux transporter periplasmic adaptor subunit n=1 Tax=Vibrio sp. SS-MA-C1-2 TaxID=2908646 RepID=UPI001F2CE552|nr:HlyD family efflux transporter periplasmic adaptor subunit [Vibrio sp. SS-MA-C1-2]UJF17116.1 HlyD family efflux transporter periplasmic adaptor subunit [Vibrio sp. SS-MA-C1-2]
MNKKLIPLVILVISAAGYYFYQQQEQQVDHRVLYGNVDIRDVNLAFRHGGRVSQLLVDEGDKVNKGQLVATLDDQPYQDMLSTSEAQVSVAKAELNNLLSGNRQQEIERARQEVLSFTALKKNAAARLTRQKVLIKDGSTSQRDLDDAQTVFNEMSAGLKSAQQNYSLATEGAKNEVIEIAKAKVALAQSQRQSAQTTLNDTKLYAPDNGTILTRVVEPGAMVGAGSPIFNLSLRNPTYIRAYVTEKQLATIVSGDNVTVTVDGNKTIYQGQIGFISSKAEFTPKSVETTELRTDLVYRIKVIVDSDDHGLNQGQPVTIQLGK